MRRPRPVVPAVLIVSQLLLLFGCTSPVPATVTRRPPTPLEPNAVIFLQATAQSGRIAESLRSAGLRPTDQSSDADYILDVRVGRQRRSTARGGVSNVAYILSSAAGRRVMTIKGRGLTGSCSPNVFDDMSQKLVDYTTD